MAVVSVTELPKRTGEINSKNERKYNRVFQVHSDRTDESALVVEASVGISIGNIYATGGGNDPLAYATTITSSQTSDDGYTWDVTVQYGPREQEEDDPTQQEVEVEWSFQQFERPIDRDADGRAILNSSGEPFQQFVTRDDSRPVLTISRNESSFNAILAWQYRDAVNADVFGSSDLGFTARPGTVKVSNITARLQFDQTYGYYYRVTYAFHFSASGWKEVLLDQGFQYKDENDDNKRKPILVNGQPVSEPALLDGNGQPLDEGDDPVWLEFEKYPKLPFSIFNF